MGQKESRARKVDASAFAAHWRTASAREDFAATPRSAKIDLLIDSLFTNRKEDVIPVSRTQNLIQKMDAIAPNGTDVPCSALNQIFCSGPVALRRRGFSPLLRVLL